MSEIDRVRDQYVQYDLTGRSKRWANDRSIRAERTRLLSDALRQAAGSRPLSDLSILDLGCGSGDLWDDMASFGVDPRRITGVDVLPHRLVARTKSATPVALASGAALPFRSCTFDLIVMFTVISSIRDASVLFGLEREAQRTLRPGGALVVYDMRLPSPGNRAVQPVTARRLDQIFPGWRRTSRSCTLLPPLARHLAPQPGRRYDSFVAAPVLRSHLISVLRPPGESAAFDGLHLSPLRDDPTISVIMPIRNETDFIERSLGAVLNQSGVPPSQIIVVDGHSDDGTADRVRQMATASGGGVTVLDNPDRIVPISMNLGLEQANGDVIVRVDGHCVIASDYLRRCLQALKATGAECVGGPMETIGTTPTAAAIAVAQSSRFGVGGVAFRTSSAASYVDTLAFGAYRREVFDRIGTFDEELVRNQDDELNLRLIRAGGRIWMDPSIRSTYFSRGTLAGLWRQYHGYGYYKLRVMKKHQTVPSFRHLVPAAFVGTTAALICVSGKRRSAWPIALVLVPYGFGVAVSSLSAVESEPRAKASTVALATTIMHVAYGLGWWAAALREVDDFRRTCMSRRRRH